MWEKVKLNTRLFGNYEVLNASIFNQGETVTLKGRTLAVPRPRPGSVQPQHWPRSLWPPAGSARAGLGTSGHRRPNIQRSRMAPHVHYSETQTNRLRLSHTRHRDRPSSEQIQTLQLLFLPRRQENGDTWTSSERPSSSLSSRVGFPLPKLACLHRGS